MSFLGSVFGGGPSVAQAQLQNPATVAQANQLYGQVQGGLGQQQGLINALAGQNGIGNQSAVFAQQQQLANQLQDASTGGGPNPALAQLANTTGQNVQQQAALAGSQRGVGQNAGMLARSVGNQGAAIQQNAAGQAAALAAQQQIAARQALQQQQGMMAGLAGQQVGQQSGAIGNYNQLAQGAQGQTLNAIGNQNQNALGQAQMQNQANQAKYATDTKLAGGLLAGGAAAATGIPMAFAHGGPVEGPRSRAGQHLHGINMQAGGHVPGQAQVQGDSYQNDTVPAMLSPGEIVVPRSVLQSANPKKSAADFVASILSRKKNATEQ